MSNDRSALTSIEREKASVFHSWSAQASINPLMVKDAHGVDVGVHDDRHRTAPDPADHRAQGVEDHLVVPEVLHLGREAMDHVALVGGERGDVDELAQQVGDRVPVGAGSGEERRLAHRITVGQLQQFVNATRVSSL